MILVKKKVEIKEGTILHSSKASYQLGTFLDDGSYGKVLRGKKLRTNEDVAVKIIKGDYLEAGPMEFKALKEIKRIKADKNNLIKCIDRFNYGSRAFIVFEMLDQNLHHFLSKRNFSPLGISEIKVISRQLLVALKALKSIGLVHTDIKLDNIMLVDHKSQPFRVKLIDFGLALKLEDLETGSIFQTMPYRAPEVRLGLSLNEGVDMWALGHTLAMLLKGSSLYPCDSDYNVIRAMVNMQGKWKLDSPIEHLMLLIDPYRRITPEEALQHPFFTENNDDNNQIVKAVSGIANKRSAKAQDPISQQDKTFVSYRFLFLQDLLIFERCLCLSHLQCMEATENVERSGFFHQEEFYMVECVSMFEFMGSFRDSPRESLSFSSCSESYVLITASSALFPSLLSCVKPEREKIK
uniref:Protein kinase domain-containing protein n=1 Tax=Oryzias latipes TaxID=8090 RepID=A0A3P9KVN1_ORYLA